MQRDFGGGAPGLYAPPANFSGGYISAGNMNQNQSQNPSPLSLYQTHQQLPRVFLKPNTQIGSRTVSSLIGKRSLSEYQALQPPPPQQPQQYQNQDINGLYFRSVRQRISEGFQPNNSYLLQQNMCLPVNVQNNLDVQQKDSKAVMFNQLQELEKQLLEDDDEEKDEVSVVTNVNSEWSETIQNLIGNSNTMNAVSPSPSSSSSSITSSASPPSILDAATAISEGQKDVALEILSRLQQSAPQQRLVEFMVSAFKTRLDPVGNPPPILELFGEEHAGWTQLLYDLSPCFRFAFMAANLAIIEAATAEERKDVQKIHLIDFDVGHGKRYVNFLHALSAKLKGRKVILKITTAGEEKKMKAVRELLSQHAERVGLVLKFNVVTLNPGNLTRESLGCDPDDFVAVNFGFKLSRMPDESVSTDNLRDALLRRVKALSPGVVTLVEQEMNVNTAPFIGRVKEVCSYYSALFNSLNSHLSRDTADRVGVELSLGRRLINTVACEGRDRVERCEVFGKWRARMSMAGFELSSLSRGIAESMQGRLDSSNSGKPGLTVKEENGGVRFGWMDRTLTVVSAWR